jgi:hypothetical protein
MERKEPSRDRRVLIALALSALVLPALTLTASAGSPLGTAFPIRAESAVEVNPAIAYNSQWHQYLVLGWNDRPGCDDVWAERLAADGRKLGGKWVAAGCPAERRHPDVAYNTKHNEYLVVWAEESGGIHYIKFQRLSAELQDLGGAVTIVQDSSPLLHPAVAYAFTSDKYLVVWEDAIPAGSSIVGKVISAAGLPEGSWVEVSLDPGGEPRQLPDLAYNRHANGYLVVWQQWYPNPPDSLWDIRGRLVNGDGGMPFPDEYIDNWNVDTTAPAVAAIPTTPNSYKYLVVWEKDSGSGTKDIYGRLVQENGTTAPGGFYLSTAPMTQSSPAVAGDEAGQRYLVTWRHPLGTVDVPIHGRAVSSAGDLLYDEAQFGGPTADFPAVAAGASGTFLVAWQDRPVFATDTDIYGQFWGNQVYLPLVVRNRH